MRFAHHVRATLQQLCSARRPIFRGWYVVLGCLLLRLATLPGHTFGINAFVDHYVRDLDLSRADVSLTWMLGSLISASMVPFAGVAFDRFGASRMAAVVAPAFIAVLVAVSRAQTWLQLTACVAAMRFLGPECLILVSSAVVQLWFVRRRGRALAVLSLARLPSWMAPYFFASLIAACGSWRSAYIALAVLFGAMMLVALCLIRDRPQAVGLLPDGEAQGDNELAPVVDHQEESGEAPSAEARTADARGASAPPLAASSLRDVTRYAVFWSYALVLTAGSICFSGLNYHWSSLAASLGGELATLSPARTSRAFFIPLSFCQFSCQAAVSIALDRRSPSQRLSALGGLSALFALTTASVLLLRSEWGLAAYGVVYGCVGGSQEALMSVMMATAFGTEALGAITGAITGASMVAVGLGPVLFAQCLSATGSYALVIVASAAVYLAAAALMLVPCGRSGL